MAERRAETRAQLLHNLRADRCACLLLSELLEGLGEEGAKEEGLSLLDTLFGLSGVLQNVARSLESAEQTVAKWE